MSFHNSINKGNNSTPPRTVGQKTQILAFPLFQGAESEQSEEFRSALLSVNPSVNLPSIQDVLYQHLFGFTTAQLRQILDIPMSVSIRESLSKIALDSLVYAENRLCEKLSGEVIFDEGLIKWKVEFVAGQVAKLAEAMATYEGINLVTGEPQARV